MNDVSNKAVSKVGRVTVAAGSPGRAPRTRTSRSQGASFAPTSLRATPGLRSPQDEAGDAMGALTPA